MRVQIPPGVLYANKMGTDMGDSTLGQVGVVYDGTSFVAHAIQWLTRSRAFHTVTGLGDGTCVSADPVGVRVVDTSIYKNIVWSKYDLTPEQAQGSADWALARVGRPYAFLDYPMLIWTAMTGMRWPHFIRKHFSNDGSHFCSELSDGALTHGAGIKVFDDGRDLAEVVPADFQRLFERYGWWTVDVLV